MTMARPLAARRLALALSLALAAFAVLVALPAGRALACDSPEHASAAYRAERAAREEARAARAEARAAVEAARESARGASEEAREEAREAVREAAQAIRDAQRAKLRAELRRTAALQPGVMLTPHALLFVDGPEVPIEWVQWADQTGARQIRHVAVTDTVVRVGPGVTLALANLAGDISVQVWDRDEVRIHAEHDRDDRIVAAVRDGVLKLGVRTREAVPAAVEWNLTVPAWLPLELSGMESEIVVTGMRSPVRAQSLRGDVVVRACQGPLEVNSVEGEVHVMDVSGNVTAESVNNVIRIVRVTGPVEAQTINGDIQLEMLTSPSVNASTVNGRVTFASPFQPHGRYAFSSHNGRLCVGFPPDQEVNVKLSSFNGRVESSVSVPMPAPEMRGRVLRFNSGRLERFNSGRALHFTTGRPPEAPQAPDAPRAPRAPRAPDAPQTPEIELESFGGLIQLASQEEALRTIDAQRAAYDSARVIVQRVRRDLARARRLARSSESPPPDAPAPPPAPHR